MVNTNSGRHLPAHILASLDLAGTPDVAEQMRLAFRKWHAEIPDFVPSDEAAEREAARVRFMRGAARKAARDNRPLGRAYREDSRDYSGYVHGGDYEQYARAYDEERAAMGGAL